MKNNAFVGAVSDYIQSIMYYDWDGEFYRKSRPCPFASFKEAIEAYELHMKRQENRKALTLDEQWHVKYVKALWRKGYVVKKLRPRRGERCVSHILVAKIAND